MIREHIRTLRETNDILLRRLAAKLDMDQVMLSKMERAVSTPLEEEI